jgi:hypothetical protein
MDSIGVLIERIVLDIAPEEIDQAPFITADFLKGGEARKKLFRQSKGGILGGSGGVDVTYVLPWILHALAVAGPFLLGLLASGAINNVISLVKDSKEFLDSLKEKPQGHHLAEQQQKLHTTIPPDQSSDPYMILKKVVDTMSHDLRASGCSPEEYERITYHVLLVLLEAPPSAGLLIQKIMEGK